MYFDFSVGLSSSSALFLVTWSKARDRKLALPVSPLVKQGL